MKNLIAPSSSRSSVVERAPKMRVLMVVECAGAGTGRHVLDLADGMIARGHEVHLAYSTGRIDKRFIARMSEIPALRSVAIDMPTAPHPRDLRALKMLRRYAIENGPFDIIHGHSSKGGAMARLAAIGTDAAAFYTLHGLIMMDPCLPRWKWLMYLGIELGLALGTSKIIAVSPEESRAAVKIGLGRERVITIPNGIAPMRLVPRAEARRTMGVGESESVIGFVGRLVEQKAPHVLIGAFAQTLQHAPHARLAIVGDGPLMQPMKELADGLNVADNIIWLGERDAREVFAGFDLFALSSRKEGLPYVVLEAMAVGLPVVATKAAGVEILIEPGLTGEVVNTDDTDAFAEALIRLTTNIEYLHSCSQAALERSKLFTVDAMVEKTLLAYQELRDNKNSHR